MKRFCILLCWICAVACLAAPPAGEWKPVEGEWKQPTKTSWQTKSGKLSFAGEEQSDRPARLSANISILEWNIDGRGYIVIMWGGEKEKQCIQIVDNGLYIGPWGMGGDKRTRQRWVPPTRRRIGLALQIDHKAAIGSIGGEKIKFEAPIERIFPIEIRIGGADVILDSLSVR